MSRRAALAVAIAAALALTGCAEPAPLPTPTPTPTETLLPTGDGVLRIGTLFPMSGDVAGPGAALVAAVETAVRDVNAAGGVLGQPVEAFYRDSGDASQDRLEAAFAELVDRGVDVVIGPTASALADRLVPLAAAAGIAVILPTASEPSVSSHSGIFFRTAPGTAQQGTAIVQQLAAARARTAALVTTGDAQGLSFERAVRAALDAAGMRLSSIEQVDAGTNAHRLAFSVAGSGPDAVILATAEDLAEQTRAILEALDARGVAGEQLWFTAQNTVDYSETLPAGLLEGASGVVEGAPVDERFAARLRQSDPALLSDRFAPEAYDAVILAALAATFAGDDGGASIASAVVRVAQGGVPCSSFGECLEVLETEPEIDYEGLSGPLTMDEAGDLIEGELGLYRYTEQNRPERVGSLSLTAR